MDESFRHKIADRQPVAAGRFYPSDRTILTKDLSDLFSECKKPDIKKGIRAIIVPHAGYVFSGKTAAAAFSSISPDAAFSNIFLVGSSHTMSFDGASVYNTGDYITPLGKARVNIATANQLIEENRVFDFPVTAHLQEHSLEVQVPIIQYYFRQTPEIVPIVIGTQRENKVKQIAEALKPYFTQDNLFIISSDFSHYAAYKDAVEVDRQTALGIISGKPSFFMETLAKNSGKGVEGLVTSMCGWTAGLMLLYLSEENDNLEFNMVDYSNSGDPPNGRKNEVVGYHAISLTEKPDQREFSFNEAEKEQLFALARKGILSRFGENETKPSEKLSSKLSEPMGAFVTLKIQGKLRGCIGRFTSSDPLYEVVQASAVSSAFGDPRFAPLSREEFDKTDFEITVLGPLKRIHNTDEIILGKHGIYIRKNTRSGTMLPQVATENAWTKEQFLGYTSRDKAGIGWDGWKDAELYVYEGVVLQENKKDVKNTGEKIL